MTNIHGFIAKKITTGSLKFKLLLTILPSPNFALRPKGQFKVLLFYFTAHEMWNVLKIRLILFLKNFNYGNSLLLHLYLYLMYTNVCQSIKMFCFSLPRNFLSGLLYGGNHKNNLSMQTWQHIMMLRNLYIPPSKLIFTFSTFSMSRIIRPNACSLHLLEQLQKFWMEGINVNLSSGNGTPSNLQRGTS